MTSATNRPVLQAIVQNLAEKGLGMRATFPPPCTLCPHYKFQPPSSWTASKGNMIAEDKNYKNTQYTVSSTEVYCRFAIPDEKGSSYI